MGVPKFFRWVTNRYPSILTGPITGPAKESNVDNLYLDMNGVIHECSHTNADVSDDLPFEVICENIFAEIKRIVNMVNPQALIYVAVDGVAPRAKLNQQRARRFRSSKDRLNALEASGATSSFDSNCITPGTEFMVRLSAALKAFIALMLRTDPHWHKLKVHFSGSEVPGEGEHKIVSFVRECRLQPSYQPDVRHCILGADADMIMLALATHEPYFLVLRDIPTFTRPKKPTSSSVSASNNTNNSTNNAHTTSTVVASDATVTTTATTKTSTNTSANTPTKAAHAGKVMNYVRINVLREFIITELLEGLVHSEYNIERIIDDFVFLTFLVGNDFLPHLPAINIGDDAFDIIFDAYKTVLAAEPGYLTYAGVLDIPRLELILTLIGVTERSLFYDQVLMQEQKVRQAAERKEKYALLRAQRIAAEAEAEAACESGTGEGNSSVVSGIEGAESTATSTTTVTPSVSPVPAELVDTTTTVGATANTSDSTTTSTTGTVALPIDPAAILDREEACKHDYYLSKLSIDIDTPAGQAELRSVVSAYLTGLQWCLQYYTTGCTSWEWFYPYHYGPFLQDMVHLDTVADYSSVSLGNPLQPFQQLLACLPAASSHLLPAPYRALMSNTSPISHFYPTDFDTDLNGKKNEYEAVVILPFIEISLLKSAEAECVDRSVLSQAEIARNTFGVSYVYSMRTNTISSTTSTATNNANNANTTAAVTTIGGDYLHIQEVPFTTTPTAPFSPTLIPGTTDPATSIPGFPSRTVLLEVVNYTKGYGKSKASRKNVRSRANCYEDEAFPMPGVVSNTDVVFEDVGSNISNSAVGGSGLTNVMNSGSVATASGLGGVVRLVVDDVTSQFLQAIAVQVAAQSPHFHPLNTSATTSTTNSTTTTTTTTTDHTNTTSTVFSASMYINLPLAELVGYANVPTYESALLKNNTLTTAGAIFGTIRCALQPVGQLGMDGTVSVKFVDVSHLAQVEQFILQRVLGNELLDSLNRLSVGSGTKSGSNSSSGGSNGSKGKSSGLSGSSGAGFERRIVIGSYTGKDSERFVEWLNQQLYKLESHLPVFTCGVVEYVGQSDDGESEEVKVSVKLSG